MNIARDPREFLHFASNWIQSSEGALTVDRKPPRETAVGSHNDYGSRMFFCDPEDFFTRVTFHKNSAGLEVPLTQPLHPPYEIRLKVLPLHAFYF